MNTGFFFISIAIATFFYIRLCTVMHLTFFIMQVTYTEIHEILLMKSLMKMPAINIHGYSVHSIRFLSIESLCITRCPTNANSLIESSPIWFWV